MATLIGYARTSGEDQVAGFEEQLARLKAEGCTKIFEEQVSSVAERPTFERALDYIREGEGDILIVTKLDRLARSARDALAIADRLKSKGASLKVLDSPLDLSSSLGELIYGMLSLFAEFERKIMLERQRAGIAKAKREGKYKGRRPTVRLQTTEILRLKAEGLSNSQIARRLTEAGMEQAAAKGKKAPRPVHRASVGRVLKAPGGI